LIQKANMLLRDPRMAFPAGLAATVMISVLGQKWCRVRHRDGYWEYRWREGTAFVSDLHLHATPGDPLAFGDVVFWDYQPKVGDVVMDVGAGLGAVLFALRTKVGPSGHVYGFEAHPATFAKLHQLCELNGWCNVDIVETAIVDRSKRVAISDCESYEAANLFSLGAHEVNGITLDEFVSQRSISHIDYLYMNIEGAERLAIQGMDRVARITDHVCISCHDFLGTDFGRTNEQVRTWLEAQGFRLRNPRIDHRRPYVQFFVHGSKLLVDA
jgi:FkbM family methyltransferase